VVRGATQAQSIQSARLSFLSSELATPAFSPCKRVLPISLAPGEGGGHSLAGEGARGASSDEGTDTLVFRYSIIPLRTQVYTITNCKILFQESIRTVI
jgi:hypothetical protein